MIKSSNPQVADYCNPTAWDCASNRTMCRGSPKTPLMWTDSDTINGPCGGVCLKSENCKQG